jgi:uncharacterized membrane protein
MASTKTSLSRLAFLDWTRGLAAVIMLNGHVFHSFTKPESRNGPSFVLTQFIGGMPPAIFLFLVGITLAFLMESRERQGVPSGQRVVLALRRAGYLMGLALLFRLQLFLFGYPQTRWVDLFKVDILNAMALAVAVFSMLAVFRTAERVRICAILGLAIAFGAPLVSALNWAGMPEPVRAYLIPDSLAFGFFPWGSFVAFGMSLGSIIRLARRDQLGSVMQWGGLLGLLLIVGAKYCSELPYPLYSSSDFWLNGPWLILIKVGVILVMLTAAYVWTQYGSPTGWSWVRQFGTTSLLVYWFHTELVYGRWLYFWKEGLAPSQAALASVGVILLMLGASVVRTNWRNWRIPRLTFEYPFLLPPRVPGD